MDDFHERLYSAAYRVRSADVLDLPPCQDIFQEVTLDAAERRAYREMEANFITWLDAGESVTATNVLAQLMRLAQITQGFLPQEGGGPPVQIGTSKADALADLIEDLGDQPIVVFCRFHHDLDMVRAACSKISTKDHQVTVSELSGRRRELEAWQAGETQVIAVQISAGESGIDLTRAHHCIYVSEDFNWGNYEQSRARVNRPGQEHPVRYYHLVAAGTIDERIREILTNREDLISSILATRRLSDVQPA
jgi:SNF2 family DNA or RNA helicase